MTEEERYNYLRYCCLSYREHVMRLSEINALLNHYGSVTQSFNTEAMGHEEFSKQEKMFMRRQELKAEQEDVMRHVKEAQKVARLHPIIHATTIEGLSIRRYAEVSEVKRGKAMLDFNKAIREYCATVDKK